jgi:hypothetical protein
MAPGLRKAFRPPAEFPPLRCELGGPKFSGRDRCNRERTEFRARASLDGGAIAQLGERVNGIHEVGGSIPPGSTTPPFAPQSSINHRISATMLGGTGRVRAAEIADAGRVRDAAPVTGAESLRSAPRGPWWWRRCLLLLLIGATLLAFAVGPAARAGLDEGLGAYGTEDYAAALTELEPLARAGDPTAQTVLGMMYERGHGVERDNSAALSWYRKAAAQNHAEAQYHLGLALRRGLNGKEDVVESARWLRRAAEQGHGLAQARLGTCYEDGVGVPRDLVQAYAWFDVAAHNGTPVAALKREELARRMTPAELAEAERRAAETAERLTAVRVHD